MIEPKDEAPGGTLEANGTVGHAEEEECGPTAL